MKIKITKPYKKKVRRIRRIRKSPVDPWGIIV